MSYIEHIIAEIEAGRYETAFPTLKPNLDGFSVYAPYYSRTREWDVQIRLDTIFRLVYKVAVEVKGYQMPLTRLEKQVLTRVMQSAYINEAARYEHELERLKNESV